MTATEYLAAIKARAEAATVGPWHWAGNTDTGEPYLATWISGAGRCQIFDIGHEERSTTGRDADRVRESAVEFEMGDPEELVSQWATDNFGEPVRDPRLRFSEDLLMVNARDRVIYEVAPQATTRDDPRVYRADIVGIRHPDATFIAATRTDVPRLVAAVEAVLAVHSPLITDRGWVCAECAQCLDDATPECPTVRAITAALDGAS